MQYKYDIGKVVFHNCMDFDEFHNLMEFQIHNLIVQHCMQCEKQTWSSFYISKIQFNILVN